MQLLRKIAKYVQKVILKQLSKQKENISEQLRPDVYKIGCLDCKQALHVCEVYVWQQCFSKSTPLLYIVMYHSYGLFLWSEINLKMICY